jgi:hypothetical protein
MLFPRKPIFDHIGDHWKRPIVHGLIVNYGKVPALLDDDFPQSGACVVYPYDEVDLLVVQSHQSPGFAIVRGLKLALRDEHVSEDHHAQTLPVLV